MKLLLSLLISIPCMLGVAGTGGWVSRVPSFKKLFRSSTIEKDIENREPYLLKGKDNGNNKLHVAVINGDTRLATLMINAKFGLDTVNKDKDTALHLAVDNGRQDLAELLIDNFAPLDAQNNDFNSALHLTALKCLKDLAEKLIKREADCTLFNKDGKMALHVAAETGCKDVAELILARMPDTVDTFTADGYTAFHLSIMNDNESVAKLLIDKGASKEKWVKVAKRGGGKLIMGGQTPLALAVEYLKPNMVEFLLNNGVQVHRYSYGRMGSLHAASNAVCMTDEQERKLRVIVERLLEAESDPFVIEEHGRTPFKLAIAQGAVALFRIFNEKIADELYSEKRRRPYWIKLLNGALKYIRFNREMVASLIRSTSEFGPVSLTSEIAYVAVNALLTTSRDKIDKACDLFKNAKHSFPGPFMQFIMDEFRPKVDNLDQALTAYMEADIYPLYIAWRDYYPAFYRLYILQEYHFLDDDEEADEKDRRLDMEAYEKEHILGEKEKIKEMLINASPNAYRLEETSLLLVLIKKDFRCDFDAIKKLYSPE